MMKTVRTAGFAVVLLTGASALAFAGTGTVTGMNSSGTPANTQHAANTTTGMTTNGMNSGTSAHNDASAKDMTNNKTGTSAENTTDNEKGTEVGMNDTGRAMSSATGTENGHVGTTGGAGTGASGSGSSGGSGK